MHNSWDQKYYLVYRIARIALQKRYQDRVNQCVSKLPTQDSSYVSPAIPAVIAQMLGLKVDFASAKLSGTYICCTYCFAVMPTSHINKHNLGN